MRRREFIAGLGAAAWPLAARAQQVMPVIGYLDLTSPNPIVPPGFREGLAAAGFVEGRNVTIEARFARNQVERLAQFAAELVQRQVSVIVAIDSGPTVLAAQAATSTIPIVFALFTDPIKFGLVASLSRPGGNMTGVTGLHSELTAKRLDLLVGMAPSAATAAYLTNPEARDSNEATRKMLEAARALGREAIILETRNALDIDAAFASLAERRAGALVVGPYIVFARNSQKIIEMAARHKIPAIYPSPGFVRSGGLMSYSADLMAQAHQIGSFYVAQILRGAKPADLPVQQPTKFNLTINLKTANALGLTVPPNLLALADEVINYEPWNIVPTVTVVSVANDPRLPLVGEAVAFWNDTFAELGTPFRLGPLTQIVGAIPVHDLTMLNGIYASLPDSLNRIGGNIIVALSEGEFISFTARRPALNKAVVAIKDYRLPPLTLPNVTRNLIAHLLGVAIGLSKNADPTALMCGRPAPCRPNIFASDLPRYFPLTEADKDVLREMYPSSWQALRV